MQSLESEVEPWLSNIESNRVKLKHGCAMLSQVEGSRVMVELCTVKQSEVEPWYSFVESSRVKQSIGSVM